MLIILGSGGGLGGGLLEAFQAKGHDSLGTCRGVARGELDIADPDATPRFWKRMDQETPAGEPLYVVNAAGRSINGYCEKLSQADWDLTIADNLTSNFLLIKSLAPILKTRPGSSMVLLSSVVAELGVPGTIAYSATKSALRGLVRTASKELARSQATINCLELGYFDRGMIEQVPSDHIASIISDIPLRRLGAMEDLVTACEFALKCRYLTGSTIKLNGGLL